jgi:hypothetical protein
MRIGDRARVLHGWMHNCGIWIAGGDLTKHQVEKNLELLKPLGISIPEPPPKLKVGLSTDQKTFLSAFLSENKIKEKDLVIGINPGIGRTSKAWLPEYYAELANYLAENFSAKIILTGTEKDKTSAHKILKIIKCPLLDLTGKTTLSQLIALMSRFNLFVSVDTGPLHIAAALGIPTVAIFPTKSLKPIEWGPWGTRHIILRKASSCPRKCLPQRCPYDDCLRAITPQDAINAACELLNGRGNKTLEESRKDWFQKSTNILTNHREIDKLLKENGYHSVFLEKSISASSLIKLMIKEDINLIHWISPRISLSLFLAKLLSSFFLSHPPLLIWEKTWTERSSEEIISLYLEKFKTRKYF